ncbi:DUF2062 domain-containing protein [Steroidobacter denitrificans]|nr:DUF2062 domain-containing protein [Steroidobacter denitrificans]
MPRRFFKPISRKRRELMSRWYMRPFRLVLEHPAYWSLNRRSVTRAFALGLFIAFIPLPVHIILSIGLALLLRLNLPAALFGTFLTNPVTTVPLYVAAYWLGCQLLDLPVGTMAFEMSWEWVTTALLPVWKPFLLGCLVLGTFSAVLGYILVGGAWYLGLVLRYRRRKGQPPNRPPVP